MGFGYELTKQQVNFLVLDCGKEIGTANLTKDEKTHVSEPHPLQLAVEVLPESPLTNK